MRSICKLAVWVVVLWLPLTVAAAAPQGKGYTDPKGFFQITPPLGWQVQEYPTDPRGKVAFHGPGQKVSLRVLVKAVDLRTLAELREGLEAIEKKVLHVSTHIQPIVFNRMPAFKRQLTHTIRGITLKIVWVDLLIDGWAHNLQYAGKPADFDRWWAAAWQSMQTYHPLSGKKPATAEEARRHEVAKWLRLAELSRQGGLTEAAKTAIVEGLRLDPQNAKLLQMKKEMGLR
ncbi:MAG: hypothetical protein AB1814_07075 [Thermodesulfobacteriota bacterium]